MKKPKTRTAFTLVELMLSMTFLAVMLVSIATLVIRMIDIYQKGLAMRAINTTGREIIADLTRVIGGSPIKDEINPVASNGNDVTAADIERAYRAYFGTTSMQLGSKTVPAGGVFCTGAYSYIWNSAPNLSNYRTTNNDGTIFTITVTDGGSNTTIVPKFSRFPDSERLACETGTDDQLATIHYNFPGIRTDDVVELINSDESDLALYDFSILPATQNNITGQIFYSGTFILATVRGGINIMSNGDFCTGKEGAAITDSNIEATDNDFDYCAVNKFNFAMRATGESSINQYGER